MALTRFVRKARNNAKSRASKQQNLSLRPHTKSQTPAYTSGGGVAGARKKDHCAGANAQRAKPARRSIWIERAHSGNVSARGGTRGHPTLWHCSPTAFHVRVAVAMEAPPCRREHWLRIGAALRLSAAATVSSAASSAAQAAG